MGVVYAMETSTINYISRCLFELNLNFNLFLLPTLSSEIDLLYLPLFRHRKNGQQSSFAGEKVHVCGSLDGQESTVSQAASLLFTFRGLNGVITSL